MDLELKQLVFVTIERVTGVNPSTLDPSRDVREQVSFDSMQFVALTAAVEKELDVELPLAVMEVSTLDEFLELIDEALEA